MCADGVSQIQELLTQILEGVQRLSLTFWHNIDMVGLTDGSSRRGTINSGTMAGVFMFVQINLAAHGQTVVEAKHLFKNSITQLASILSRRLSIPSVYTEPTRPVG
jgi:hypothetical protein